MSMVPRRTLLVIHGMPAVGKLTVATALEAVLTQCRQGESWTLYHNHMVVDEVLTRHAFGTPGFVRERDERWREGLVSRLSDPSLVANGGGVIFTYNTENTVPPEFVSWLFNECCQEAVTAATATISAGDALLPQESIKMVSVCLVADQAVAISRVDTDDRKQRKKLQDKDFYEKLIQEGTFLEPAIPRTDLIVETSTLQPDEASLKIAAFLFP